MGSACSSAVSKRLWSECAGCAVVHFVHFATFVHFVRLCSKVCAVSKSWGVVEHPFAVASMCNQAMCSATFVQ